MIGRLLKDVDYLSAGDFVVIRGCDVDVLKLRSGDVCEVQAACMGWNVWTSCDAAAIVFLPAIRRAVGGSRSSCGWEYSSLAQVVNGYLTAALWSTCDYRYPEGEEVDGDDYHGEPFDSWAGIEDCTERLVVHALADCSAMMAEVGRAFDRYCARIGSAGVGSTPAERFGHDFWLTRERHGCGFWDRGLDTLGEYLSDVARRYGSVNIYSVPIDGAGDEIENREVTV